MTTHPRDLLLERFPWIGGHADVWRIFRDPRALAGVVGRLARPFQKDGITAVCGIESRGLLLGAAMTVELGAGFVAVRKDEGTYARVVDAELDISTGIRPLQPDKQHAVSAHGQRSK